MRQDPTFLLTVLGLGAALVAMFVALLLGWLP